MYPPQLIPGSRTHALQHVWSHPFLLTRILQNEFGHGALLWDPSVIWHECATRIGVVPSNLSRAKIQAVRTIMHTYRVWEDWPLFSFVGVSLSRVADASYLQKMTAVQCVQAATILQAMSSVGRHTASLSSEVLKYIAAALHEDGVVYAPHVLAPANRYLRLLTRRDLHDRCRDALLSDAPTQDPEVQSAVDRAAALDEYGSWYTGLADEQTRALGLLGAN